MEDPWTQVGLSGKEDRGQQMSEEGARSRHLFEVGEVRTRGTKELGRGEEIVDREQTFVIPTKVLPAQGLGEVLGGGA